MCDILIVGPANTKEGIFIFAKNSDRDPNEAQIVEFIEGGEFQGDRIKLTYVEIEISKINSLKKINRINTVLLSRPWWIWGAEMGANEHGLVIGNTAVFTKRLNKKPGILGMDIIRLALMFKSSAIEAVELITEIIEKFGQGGSGSYERKLFYDNSFIVADPTEAYVVETAGNNWVAKRARNYLISNRLTISDDWDKCYVKISQLNKLGYRVNFAKRFSDRFFTFFAHGSERCKFTRASLGRNDIDLIYMIKVLSSTTLEGKKFTHVSPTKGSMRDVCMHYGGLLRPSQTASSQISELYKDLQVHWITGTSLPCLSIFKPVYLVSGFPNLNYAVATNKYDPESYWWYAERFHRKFQLVYEELIDEFSQEREALQSEIIKREREVRLKYLNGIIGKDELYKLTSWAFELERDLITRWEDRVSKIQTGGKIRYRLIWSGVNRKAGINF